MNFDKTKQEIGDVTSSQAVQVSGNDNQVTNNYGMTYTEVKDLCTLLIRDELTKYSTVATSTMQARVDEMGDRIIERLKNEDDSLFIKFQKPAIQYSLFNSLLSYSRSEDGLTNEQLVDSFIDRLKSAEHSTMASVVDEAIAILPKLSLSAITMLALLVFKWTRFGMSMDFTTNLEAIRKLLPNTVNISKIDIAYLSQTNCCQGFQQSFFVPDSLETLLSKTYDLYFIRDLTDEAKAEIQRLFPLNLGTPGFDMSTIALCTDGTDYSVQKEYCMFTSMGTWKTQLTQKQKFDLIEKAEACRQYFVTLLPEEIKAKFLAKDPIWNRWFDLMNKSEVKCLQLSPLGVYLGTAALKKLCGINISMDIFYQ